MSRSPALDRVLAELRDDLARYERDEATVRADVLLRRVLTSIEAALEELELLSLSEAHERFGLSPSAISRAVSVGLIRNYAGPGHRLKVSAADLSKYVTLPRAKKAPGSQKAPLIRRMS